MNIILHWPQITYLLYMATFATLICVKAHHARMDRIILERVISCGFILFLLYMGGFFGGAQ